jgi:gluconate 2-dehydrogenase gamma chain
MIDRRELLQRAAMLLGGTVSSSAALGVLGGCAATPKAMAEPPPPPRFFTLEEARTVEAMAEQIMPRTDTLGAIDAGVPAFIDRMMADFYQDGERTSMREGLTRVATDSHGAHGHAFAALTAEQQVALMTAYDREAFDWVQAGSRGVPPFFRMMKELTTLGFFTSQAGAAQFLRYDPVPGKWRPDVPYAEIGHAWAT